MNPILKSCFLLVMACAVSRVASAQQLIGEHNFTRDLSKANEEIDPEELVSILLNLDLRKNIMYAHDRDPGHQLHLLLPRERTVEGPVPLVVWIHGGGWMGQNQDSGIDRVTQLVRTGRYAAASINYRPSSEARWPAQIHDCNAALRWLRAHAEEFGIDPERIAVMGIESGGHLASMIGIGSGEEDLEGGIGRYPDDSGGVACVIDLWGPTDFLQMDDHLAPGATLKHSEPGSPEIRLVGGSFQNKAELVASTNPISRISGPSPPFLIIHSKYDLNVPHHQSELLQEALEQNGDEVTMVTLTNGNTEIRAPEIDQLIMAFLEREFYGVGEPIQDQEITLRGVKPPRGARPDRGGERPDRGGERPDRGGERTRPSRGEAGENGERPERTRDRGRGRSGGAPDSEEAGDTSGDRGQKKSRNEQFFEKSDRNSDGKLTQDELPRGRQFQGTVEKYDQDGDGALQYEEFLELIKELGSPSQGRGRGGSPGQPPKPSS